MSMEALCALSVSWMRIGSARALMSWSLPLLCGYCTTATSVIEPSATVIWTCTGPHRVSATVPVNVPDVAEPVVLAALELLDELELPVVGVVVLLLYGVLAEVLPPTAATVEDVEVLYPKSSTRTVSVLISHMTIFFMGSPTEALYVETVTWQAGGLGRTADVVGPRLGAAHVHVALGDVRSPVGQGGQVAGRPDAVPEPGTGRPPVPGQPDDLEPALGSERLQFAPEQRVAARVPVQQDGVAGCVLQFLGERPQ